MLQWRTCKYTFLMPRIFCRYPFYLSQLLKKENAILTWLRYTVWVVLYPIGFTCEAIVLYFLLLQADRTGLWSVELPNVWNFTFHFATVLRIIFLTLYVPGCYSLLTYMYRVRKQKLGKRTISSKPKTSQVTSKRLCQSFLQY